MTGASESPRWRDAEPVTFAGTILAAAEQLGELTPHFPATNGALVGT